MPLPVARITCSAKALIHSILRCHRAKFRYHARTFLPPLPRCGNRSDALTSDRRRPAHTPMCGPSASGRADAPHRPRRRASTTPVCAPYELPHGRCSFLRKTGGSFAIGPRAGIEARVLILVERPHRLLPATVTGTISSRSSPRRTPHLRGARPTA